MGRDHYQPREPSYFENISKTVVGGLLCAGVATASVAGTALTGGAAAGTVLGAGLACASLVTLFETASDKEKWRMLEEANRRHRALVEAKNRQDRPSGGTTPKETPDATTTTTTPKGPSALTTRSRN